MSTASSVPDVKTGLRQFLAATEGLRPADGVLVHSAIVTPDETGLAYIVLGPVTAPQGQPGLVGRSETPTMTCYSTVVTLGNGEEVIAEARAGVYALINAVQAAIGADPSAAGTVPPPGRLTVTTSSLEEAPVDLDGAAARRAQLSFEISWTSHLL